MKMTNFVFFFQMWVKTTTVDLFTKNMRNLCYSYPSLKQLGNKNNTGTINKYSVPFSDLDKHLIRCL